MERDPDGMTARRLAERAAALAGDDTDPAFRPVEPTDREDPYDAFATAVAAPETFDGPLSGLRVATTDNVAVGGITHAAGTDGLDWTPELDATVVERLRSAGAELAGTTRMDPLALGVTGEQCAAGPTDNPVADGRVPGGSSSGSGAAVAGELVDAALGTDTGGSVRVPASFCGVVGVKPTYDRVPRTGVADLAPTLDHVGVLAADAETAARLLDVVSGGDPLRPGGATASATNATAALEEPLGRVRIGIPEEFVAAATREVRATFERALADLARHDRVTVERVALPEHEGARVVNRIHTLAEFASVLDRRGQPVGDGRDPALRAAMRDAVDDTDVPDRVRRLVGIGRQLMTETPDAYGNAWDARRRLARRVQVCFDAVDVLVAPTTPMVAPRFGEVGDGPDARVDVSDVRANTAPFDLTGQPTVSVPCGTARGLSVGAQVVAPARADERALRVAHAVESL